MAAIAKNQSFERSCLKGSDFFNKFLTVALAPNAEAQQRPVGPSAAGAQPAKLASAAAICWVSLDWRNSKVLADFLCENVADFRMARNGGTIAKNCVVPPRMATALAQQLASVRPKMAHELISLHTAMRSST